MAAEPGQWSSEAWVDADDADLLALTREGSSEAFAELWRRHLPAAYAVATRYKGRAAAEDVVADASLRVYQLLQAGKGPQTHFRSYFLTTVKTVAVDSARRDLRVVPTEDTHLEVLTGTEEHEYEAVVDQGLVRTAFQSLSERDQQVLWHTSVEGHSPSAVAEVMGMSPNGVSVTALRAKDALRARYLDAHAERAISRADSDECRWVMERMGRYVRGKLPRRQHLRVEEHIDQCAHARALALEMTEVNRALPALIVPIIFMAACGSGHVVVAGLASAVAGAAGSGDASSGSSASSAGGGAAAASGAGLVLGPGLAAAVGLSSAPTGMPGGALSSAGGSSAGGAGAGAAGAGAAGAGIAGAGLATAAGPGAAGVAGAGAAAGAGAGAGAGGAALGAATMAASILGKTAAVVVAAGLGAAFVGSPTGQAALASGPMGSTSTSADVGADAGPTASGNQGQPGSSSQPGSAKPSANVAPAKPGSTTKAPATKPPATPAASSRPPAYPVYPTYSPRPRKTPRPTGTWVPPITITVPPAPPTTAITKTTPPVATTTPTKTTTTPTTTTTTPTTTTTTTTTTPPDAKPLIEEGNPVRITAPGALLVVAYSMDGTNIEASGSGWECSPAVDRVGALACAHLTTSEPAGVLQISGKPTKLRVVITWRDGFFVDEIVELG